MTAATASRRLPDGFEVRLRDDVRRVAGGTVLVGGSPVRVLRLSARARALLAHDRLTVDSPTTAALARRLLDGNLASPALYSLRVSPDELTVVVPVRDRSAQLARCLTALVPLSVVVVDDASEDPDAVARVARRYGARVVPLVHNLGPAGARNRGFAEVTSPLVAFVDSDVVVDAAALLSLARHCADPVVALVGPRVIGRSRRQRMRWFERYDAVASSLDLGRVPGQVRAGAHIGWLPSACLVGRVADLGAGFDGRLRVGEDVDLVWRLVDAGFAVRYDPSVSAQHDIRTTTAGWLARKFVYGSGGADLAARHGDKVAPAILSLGMGVSAAVLLGRHRWALPLAALSVTHTARSLRRNLPVEQGSTAVATGLAVRGLGWAVRQEAGLLLRHWWPLTALALPFSRSVRRAAATAVVLDLALFLRERPGVGPATALVARRLDDLAYGAGLWWGAFRRRDLRCLAVRGPRRPWRSSVGGTHSVLPDSSDPGPCRVSRGS